MVNGYAVTICISKLNYEIRRLQWHCHNLNAGQEITVFENDLLFEEEHTRIARYQSLIDEINNQAKIISDKHMLNRVNAADALYALDLKLDLPDARDERTVMSLVCHVTSLSHVFQNLECHCH